MSDSLYSQYLRERTDIQIFETEAGFATYSIAGEECYIRDLYVVHSARQKGCAKKIADVVVSIAKEKGCTYLVGSICPSTNGADISLKVLIAYGMKLHSARENLIIFKKEIV